MALTQDAGVTPRHLVPAACCRLDGTYMYMYSRKEVSGENHRELFLSRPFLSSKLEKSVFDPNRRRPSTDVPLALATGEGESGGVSDREKKTDTTGKRLFSLQSPK